MFVSAKAASRAGKAAQTLLPSGARVFCWFVLFFQEWQRCLLYFMALFLMLYRTHITRESELLITNILKENEPSCCGWVYLVSLLVPGRQTTAWPPACGLAESRAAQMRVIFQFPDCFLSLITYFQQVELLLKEERKVSGGFPNTLLVISQERLKNRHVFQMFFYSFKLFFSVFCALLTLPLLESKARKPMAVNPICLCRVYRPPLGTEHSPTCTDVSAFPCVTVARQQCAPEVCRDTVPGSSPALAVGSGIGGCTQPPLDKLLLFITPGF